MIQWRQAILGVLISSLTGLLFAQDPQAPPPSFAECPDIQSDRWQPLLNGTDLGGWVRRNGSATFEVKDGQIHGQTTIGSPNSYLCTEKAFADFELTFEVKVDSALNSGIQLRSAAKQNVNNGRVYGPQVEIECASSDPKNPCESGYIYSEGTGRGWISQNRRINDAFQPSQWNRYVIRAVGSRIQIWINGRKIEDLHDDHLPAEGFIALQVHSVPNDAGSLSVRWRDLRIRVLQRRS